MYEICKILTFFKGYKGQENKAKYKFDVIFNKISKYTAVTKIILAKNNTNSRAKIHSFPSDHL